MRILVFGAFNAGLVNGPLLAMRVGKAVRGKDEKTSRCRFDLFVFGVVAIASCRLGYE